MVFLMDNLEIDLIKLSDTQVAVRTNGNDIKIGDYDDEFFYQAEGSLDCGIDSFDIGTKATWKIIDIQREGVSISRLINEVRRYNTKVQKTTEISMYEIITVI